MSNAEVEILLAEYKVNVDLWQHDDDLRQKRAATFLTVNLFLFGIVAFVIKESVLVGEWTVIASISAVLFGILTCSTWFFVHKRSEQYLRFRRRQLVEIEGKLGTADTFTKQYSAITLGEEIRFERSKDGPFVIPRIAAVSSSTLESLLPFALIVIWTVICVFVIAKIGKPPEQPAKLAPPSMGSTVKPIPPQSN
jgi:hypothetical protein